MRAHADQGGARSFLSVHSDGPPQTFCRPPVPLLQVVSREEAVARIRAAVDARDEGANILIAARSDSRSTTSIDEALWRAAAFADQARCKCDRTLCGLPASAS